MRPLYLLLASTMLIAPAAWAGGQECLATLEHRLTSRFTGTAHVIPEEVERLRVEAPDNVVLIDTRPNGEHAVGHIAGSIRIDPDQSPEAIVAALGDRARGKTIVFYCSVGYRSSIMATRANRVLDRLGAVSAVNLKGGLFHWHNTGRAMVDAFGETPLVHPYDQKWGEYVEFSNMTRMTPRTP